MTTKQHHKSRALKRLEAIENILLKRKKSTAQVVLSLLAFMLVVLSVVFVWQSIVDNGHDRVGWGMINQFYAMWCVLVSLVCAIAAKV